VFAMWTNSSSIHSLLFCFRLKMIKANDLSLLRSFEQGPVTDSPFPTLTNAFYHCVTSFPDAKAVLDLSKPATRELTYRELASQVQTLTLRLHSLGVGPGHRVPLVVKRGLEMIVGIWAILSCGAQYIPLDGGVVPDSTIRVVIEQSGSSVVLCIASTEHRLREFESQPGFEAVIIEQNCKPDTQRLQNGTFLDLASAELGCYVIYTSGTHQ
jgi:non-ribosomal peptide synthetase component F